LREAVNPEVVVDVLEVFLDGARSDAQPGRGFRGYRSGIG
jgi:hypothetical protein